MGLFSRKKDPKKQDTSAQDNPYAQNNNPYAQDNSYARDNSYVQQPGKPPYARYQQPNTSIPGTSSSTSFGTPPPQYTGSPGVSSGTSGYGPSKPGASGGYGYGNNTSSYGYGEAAQGRATTGPPLYGGSSYGRPPKTTQPSYTTGPPLYGGSSYGRPPKTTQPSYTSADDFQSGANDPQSGAHDFQSGTDDFQSGADYSQSGMSSDNQNPSYGASNAPPRRPYSPSNVYDDEEDQKDERDALESLEAQTIATQEMTVKGLGRSREMLGQILSKARETHLTVQEQEEKIAKMTAQQRKAGFQIKRGGSNLEYLKSQGKLIGRHGPSETTDEELAQLEELAQQEELDRREELARRKKLARLQAPGDATRGKHQFDEEEGEQAPPSTLNGPAGLDQLERKEQQLVAEMTSMALDLGRYASAIGQSLDKQNAKLGVADEQTSQNISGVTSQLLQLKRIENSNK